MGKGEKMNNESCRREPCNVEMWRKRKKVVEQSYRAKIRKCFGKSKGSKKIRQTDAAEFLRKCDSRRKRSS
jgi:hypothetical protein